MSYYPELKQQSSMVNLRERPTMDSRVVSSLLRSVAVSVTERRETPSEGVWLSTGRGWALSLFLRSHIPESRNAPSFLSFDPNFERLRDRLENVENLIYANTQGAADEGSRSYSADPERVQRERGTRAAGHVLQAVEIIRGGGGPDRGMVGIERNHRWMRMQEFERNVARYQVEARNLLGEIVRIRQ